MIFPLIQQGSLGNGDNVSNIVDAKGDLLVATADNTLSRIAVGSNDQVLTADSAQAGGVKWAAGGGSGSLTYHQAQLTSSVVIAASDPGTSLLSHTITEDGDYLILAIAGYSTTDSPGERGPFLRIYDNGTASNNLILETLGSLSFVASTTYGLASGSVINTFSNGDVVYLYTRKVSTGVVNAIGSADYIVTGWQIIKIA